MNAHHVTFSSLLISVSLFAGSINLTPLTWEACLKEAAEKNPDVAAAEQAVKAADAQAKGAYSGFFPQLSATGGYTESSSGVITSTGAGGAVVGGVGSASNQKTFSAGITATENLFNGFQDLGKIRQSRANLEVARAQWQLAKATLSANLKTAFAELLFEQKSVELTARLLKRQETNLRLVNLRFEGGRENKGNLLFQQATVSQARYQNAHAIRNVRVGIKQLAALLGRPDTEELQASGELAVQAPPVKLDAHALATKHPTHTQAYFQQAAADAGIMIAEQGWYPELNVTGFVGKTGPDFFPQTNRWSVGAQIVFPFFPGTSHIFSAETARAQKNQTDHQLRSTDYKLIAALEQTYSAVKDAIETVKVSSDFAEAAKARSIISTEKYNTGLMAFEDWSVIETDLVNREQTLLVNQRNAMQAEANWEAAQGTGAIP